MAKRRVFELARELNMGNKELLDKIQELDIEVSSHLSSLEDETVEQIKNALFGRKKEAAVEDTRVRPNVIRRRRKAAPRPPEPEAQAASQPESEEIPPEGKKPEEKKEDIKQEAVEKPAESLAQEVEEKQEQESQAQTIQPPAEPHPSPRASRKQSDSEPARIVKKPEEKPEEKAPEPPAEETGAIQVSEKEPVPEEEKPSEKMAAPEPEETSMEPAELQKEPSLDEKHEAAAEKTEPEEQFPAEAQEEPAGPIEAQPADTGIAPADDKKPEEAGQEAAGPVAEPEKPAEPQAKKTAKPKKTKKKTKKGEPAKIISLPEPEPELTVPAEAEIPVEEPDKNEVAAQAKTEEEKRRSKKKKAPAEILDEPEKSKKPSRKKGGFKRKEVVEGDALYDQRFGRGRKSKKKGKAARSAPEQRPQITTPKAIKRRIKIDDNVVLSDLAKRMGIKGSELIKRLMEMGMMVTLNQSIDFETAELLASEYQFEVEKAAFEEETIFNTEDDSPEQLLPRPPVVTIMGHVDHGKTSLLDVIRHSKITEKEAGGITQHIGAYRVPYENGDIIFLDTPGHEAFTAMRARGAKVTDLVILVVAADDGVMPQTVEAIDHSKAAGVPIIVAINKIDKPGAEPDRIKRELAEKGLVPEEWGGDTICVPVSAKQETGIDDLLEMVLLQSEVLELKANPNKFARGFIIESRLETGRGPVATVLINEGTLHTGDPVVSGIYYGKIRAMFDDLGKPVKEAGPSYPVEIIGLSGVPMAGDELNAVAEEKDAKQVSEHRMEKQRSRDLSKTTRMSLESLYEKMQEGEVKDLNLIIKADVQGSIEALKDSLTRLSSDEVKVNVVHSAAGTIHESDVSLAAVSNAIILGFNVRPAAKVAHFAEEENVDIKYYNIIYNAIKDIKDAMVGLMESRYEQRVLGQAEVRQVFHVPSMGSVAGCMVLDGKIQRGQPIRLIRDGIVIHEGKIGSLKRFKDDVKEVLHNYECGIGIEKFNDIKVGDIIECYYLEEIKPVIE
jgi:translation initiation factor IF-2